MRAHRRRDLLQFLVGLDAVTKTDPTFGGFEVVFVRHVHSRKVRCFVGSWPIALFKLDLGLVLENVTEPVLVIRHTQRHFDKPAALKPELGSWRHDTKKCLPHAGGAGSL